MDLTKSYPRSVNDKIFGVVQIARTIDKAKASLAGTLGEYDYDCPMDKHIFEFLGINAGQLTDAIKNAKSDAEIEAFIKPYAAKKSAAEIEKFNFQSRLEYGPAAGTPGYDYFMKMRGDVAPDRKDVTAWADLLDLDEKRPVPQRAAA